jgi:hypothetical protein
MDTDEQARWEEQWRKEELQRQRAQAALDRWVENQRADAAEERRLWRELDPYNFWSLAWWQGAGRERRRITNLWPVRKCAGRQP